MPPIAADRAGSAHDSACWLNPRSAGGRGWRSDASTRASRSEMMEAMARASRVPVSWLIADSRRQPASAPPADALVLAAASAITDRGGLARARSARRCDRAAKPTRKRLPIHRVDAALADRSARGRERGGARGRVRVELRRLRGVPACGSSGLARARLSAALRSVWTGRSTGCWFDRVAGSRCWCWPIFLARSPE